MKLKKKNQNAAPKLAERVQKSEIPAVYLIYHVLGKMKEIGSLKLLH